MKKFIVLKEGVEIWSGKASNEDDALDKAGIEVIEQ
jgi:hypothetical protein